MFWNLTVHDVQPYSSEDFNVTHHINSLSFGSSLVGKANPLDGFLTAADKGRIIRLNMIMRAVVQVKYLIISISLQMYWFL